MLIPEQNIEDLVLKEEVIEAVEEGTFNIYSIKHISQGIEILTGMTYEQIKDLVNEKLRFFNEKEKKDDEK